MASYQITVVMPALNEEKNVVRAVTETMDAFEQLRIVGEVLLVNDGSKDETAKLAEELKQRYNNLQVIHHEKPHGIGSSFWEGGQKAHGEVVTMLPGDGENDPVEILRYLPLMREVDIVVPFVYNQEVRGRRRRWVSRTYKAIINLSFGLLLNYMNGTVMYRRSVLQSLDLHSKGFFYQTELLIKAIRKGYLYAEVPYALGTRTTGKSKALTLRSLFKLTKDFLLTAYSVYFVDRGREAHYPTESVTGQRRGSAT
jgi:glycosyltransferase involved in cell wall biosynthesis